MRLYDKFGLAIEGHVKIREFENMDDLTNPESGKIILDKRNAVHPEHMSIVLARGLANRPNGSVYTMNFGTGGATVDPLGNIIYAVPNTTGAADLNNPVYFEVVDDTEGAPSGNQIAIRHINGTLFSDVEIVCVLDKNEPFGQPAFDNTAGTNINTDQFTFDEIGLKTLDGLLLTHVCFSPISKSSNRILQVVYTLRISITE